MESVINTQTVEFFREFNFKTINHTPRAGDKLLEDDRQRYYDRYRRQEMTREQEFTIGKGDFLIDIGPGHGLYSLCALAAGAQGVVRVNGNPTHNTIFHENCSLNGWGVSDPESKTTSGVVDIISRDLDNRDARFDDGLKIKDLPCRGPRLWVHISSINHYEVIQGMGVFIQQYQPIIMIGSDQALTRL